MILGLDISTSIVGVTILDEGQRIVANTGWDLRNKRYYPDIFVKSDQVKQLLQKIEKEFDIKKIYIEKSLQTFRSGFSSAKTLSTLSAFNGIVSWICYDTFGIEPEYISAPTARRMCGIKVPRGQKAKEVVLKFLLDTEPSFEVEYTRNNNPKPDSYDRADSLIIAKAGFLLCQHIKS